MKHTDAIPALWAHARAVGEQKANRCEAKAESWYGSGGGA